MNQLGYSLILTNEDGESVDLYDDPDFALTSTDGFGTNAEVNTQTLSNADGAYYQNTYVPARELSMTVQYRNDSYNPEIAKIRLHNVLKIRQKIKLTYISPNKNCYIYGYIKVVDTPENTYPMVTQINMLCPDPFWNSGDDEDVVVDVNGSEVDIDYDGDSPTGFVTTIKFTSSFDGVQISVNDKTFESHKNYASTYKAVAGFSSGSTVVIDSRHGEKSVMYYADSDLTKAGKNYFASTKCGLLFPQLQPGHNHITILTGGNTYTGKTGFKASIAYRVKSMGGV